MLFLLLLTTKCWFIKRQAGRTTVERKGRELPEKKNHLCPNHTFPREKLCLYLFLADSQHYPITFVAVSAASGQVDSMPGIV